MTTTRNYANNVSATTLNGAVNASVTAWVVTNGVSYPAVPFAAKCENEIVLVTAKSGTNNVNWTVVRAFDGTAGASHATATEVTDAVIAGDFDSLTPLWERKRLARLVARPDATTAYDDEFSAASGAAIDAKWAVNTVTGAQTLLHDGVGRLAVTPTTLQSASDLNYASQSLSGLSAPVTIETAIQWNGFPNSFLMGGPCFTDGVLAAGASNMVALMPYLVTPASATPGIAHLSLRAGTATNIATVLGTDRYSAFSGGGQTIFYRLRWVSANTWAHFISYDGQVWSQQGLAASYASTMTPTHFGFVWSTWGGAIVGNSISMDYFRVNPTA